MYNKYYKFEKEKGYDYDYKGSRALKWMKEEFQDKMVKYLGSKTFVKKQSRMEKIEMKERLGFKNEINPIIRIFSRINQKVERDMLVTGFNAII